MMDWLMGIILLVFKLLFVLVGLLVLAGWLSFGPGLVPTAAGAQPGRSMGPCAARC